MGLLAMIPHSPCISIRVGRKRQSEERPPILQVVVHLASLARSCWDGAVAWLGMGALC